MNLQNKEKFIAEANDLFLEVFNYFNGKVNTTNYPAVLHIDWKSSSGIVMTMMPNVITLCPKCMLLHIIQLKSKRKNKKPVYNLLLEYTVSNIIYGLFTIDRCIDYSRYHTNEEQEEGKQISLSMAAKYILDHNKEIEDKFGTPVTLDQTKLKNAIATLAVKDYHRKTYADHITEAVLGSLHEINKKAIFTRKETQYRLENNIGKITLHSQDETLLVQDGEFKAPIWEVNNFLWEHYYSIINIATLNVRATASYEEINYYYGPEK